MEDLSVVVRAPLKRVDRVGCQNWAQHCNFLISAVQFAAARDIPWLTEAQET